MNKKTLSPKDGESVLCKAKLPIDNHRISIIQQFRNRKYHLYTQSNLLAGIS